MGGCYLPIVQGEIDGHKVGVSSSITLDEYSKEVDQKQRYAEYWIGFKIGFFKGAELRKFLFHDIRSALTFEEKINYYLFVCNKQEVCRTNVSESYLANIEHWAVSSISTERIQYVYELLKENKTQHAMHILYHYYKDNFQLKGVIKMDGLLHQLKSFRKKKKINNEYNLLHDYENIRTQLIAWIEELKNNNGIR